MLPDCSKFQIGMSRRLDTPSAAQMAQIMGKHRSSCGTLERNLYGHPLAGLLWERQFETILLKYVWEKVFNLECLFVQREGLFLSVYVDEKKTGWKEAEHRPNVENS